MTRTPRNDNSQSKDMPERTPDFPAKPDAAPERDELEKRIERLEKRIEETIDGIEGSATVRTGRTVDETERGDPLRRAVERSNEKRDPEK